MSDRGADERAFNALFADMVERLLAASDNPAQASAYIAEELRALVGARTVLVFQSLLGGEGSDHRLVSVYPERRKALADREGMERLLALAANETRCLIVAADGRSVEADETSVTADGTSVAAGSSPEAAALRELGSASAVIAPLAYGSRRVGALVLLDLFDPATTSLVIEPIERLSSIFALVLKNADLFSHLEEEVAERTRLLEDRTRQLEASLREKEVLLKEVNHRVKNNLQIVMSLLYLKASTAEEGAGKAALEDSQARVYAMALVHEELYRTGDFETVDLAAYAGRLADRILDTCCDEVEREYRLASLTLPLDTALPCGLILAELVMNAAKHAFRAGGGTRLTLAVFRDGADAVVEVSDDGPGLPPGKPPDRPGAVGFTIVESLLGQLKARLERGTGGGAAFRLRFPIA